MDALTLGEANDLGLYWIEAPPSHISLAGIARGLGGKRATVKTAAPKAARVGTDEEAMMFSEQLRSFAQGIASRNHG